MHITGHLGTLVLAVYEEWADKAIYECRKLAEFVRQPELLFVNISSPWQYVHLWELLLDQYGKTEMHKKFNERMLTGAFYQADKW